MPVGIHWQPAGSNPARALRAIGTRENSHPRLSPFEGTAFVTNAMRNYITSIVAGSSPALVARPGSSVVERRRRFAQFLCRYETSLPQPGCGATFNHTPFPFCDECRWDYIPDKDEDAGSIPAGSTSTEP